MSLFYYVRFFVFFKILFLKCLIHCHVQFVACTFVTCFNKDQSINQVKCKRQTWSQSPTWTDSSSAGRRDPARSPGRAEREIRRLRCWTWSWRRWPRCSRRRHRTCSRASRQSWACAASLTRPRRSLGSQTPPRDTWRAPGAADEAPLRTSFHGTTPSNTTNNQRTK